MLRDKTWSRDLRQGETHMPDYRLVQAWDEILAYIKTLSVLVEGSILLSGRLENHPGGLTVHPQYRVQIRPGGRRGTCRRRCVGQDPPLRPRVQRPHRVIGTPDRIFPRPRNARPLILHRGGTTCRPTIDSNYAEDLQGHMTCVDGVVCLGDRIVVPLSLRQTCLDALHAAHQGISGTSSIFWPGVTRDILGVTAGNATATRPHNHGCPQSPQRPVTTPFMRRLFPPCRPQLPGPRGPVLRVANSCTSLERRHRTSDCAQ